MALQPAASQEVAQPIPPNVKALGWVSFFTDIASEMVYPAVPVFLTTVLHASAISVGVIEGAAEATASLLKAASGWFSDRVSRRKPFVVLGYTLSAFAKPLIGVAAGPFVVLLGRLLDRLGKGIRTAPRDALIAASTPASAHGRAFGFHRGLDTAGAVIGPLLALALLSVLGGNLRLIFILATIPAALGVLLLAGVVREAPPGLARSTVGAGLRLRDLPFQFKLFLAASLVFAFGNSSDAFLILRAKDLGLSTSLAILAYALFNACYAALSYPLGRLSDRVGSKRLLVLGFVVFAAVYAAFGLVRDARSLWLLFPLYGCYMALTEGVGKALIARLVPHQASGTAFGLHQAVVGIAALGASVIAGVLWEAVSPSAAFLFGAVMALAAALLLASVRVRQRAAGQGA